MRNLRLFAFVLSVETRKLFSYRVDFWLNALGSFVVQVGVAYFLWQAVYEHTGDREIAGYTFAGMVTYYVLAVLLAKIVRADVRQMAIADDIYQGSLTRFLLYPATYPLFKYAEQLGNIVPALLQIFVFGGIIALAFGTAGLAGASLGSVLMCVGALAAGNVIGFLLQWPVQAAAFWIDKVWTLNVMLRFSANFLGGMMLPLTLLPGWAQTITDWLPFRYLYSFPVNTLLGRVSGTEWITGMLGALAWCCVLALLTRMIWRRGELTYTGVGI